MPQAAIPALITGGLGLASSLIGSHAASSAANAQEGAANAGIAEQQREYNQTRTDLMPWMTAGQNALGGLQGLLGLSGADAQQAAITGLQNSPLYQSLYRNGVNTLLANEAATGGLRGGNAEHSLFNEGSDLLAQVIQNQIGNLQGLSGSGLGAAGSLGELGGNNANAITGLLLNRGTAAASGALGTGSAWASGLNGIASLFAPNGALSGIFGGGGSSTPFVAGGGGLSGLANYNPANFGF